jgi:hypothetical protein
MPRHEPLHPELVVALRALDADGLPYAEMWRRTRPVAARIGVPQPSYWRVRRFLIEERRRKQERTDRLNAVLEDVLRGYPPRLDKLV